MDRGYYQQPYQNQQEPQSSSLKTIVVLAVVLFIIGILSLVIWNLKSEKLVPVPEVTKIDPPANPNDRVGLYETDASDVKKNMEISFYKPFVGINTANEQCLDGDGTTLYKNACNKSIFQKFNLQNSKIQHQVDTKDGKPCLMVKDDVLLPPNHFRLGYGKCDDNNSHQRLVYDTTKKQIRHTYKKGTDTKSACLSTIKPNCSDYYDSNCGATENNGILYNTYKASTNFIFAPCKDTDNDMKWIPVQSS